MSAKDPIRIAEKIYKHPDADKDHIFDFSSEIEDATLSSIAGDDGNGVMLGVTFSPSGPILEAAEINAAAVTKNGVTTAIGKGVSVSIHGGTADTTYEVTCKARTSAGETVVAIGTLVVTPA